MSRLDDIFNIVKQQPVLPIEIAPKLNLDSFMTKAFLDQLVEAGKLKMTSEKISGVPVYFTAGQELIADSKIKKLLGIKPTAKTFAAVVPQSPALEQKRAEFKARLEEIEKREEEQKKSKAGIQKPKVARPKTEIAKVKAEAPKPKIEILVKREEHKLIAPVVREAEIKPEEITPKVVVEQEPKPSIEAQVVSAVKKLITGAASPAIELTLTQLNSAGAEILSKEITKRGKEASIVAKIPSSIGPLQFLVIVQSKKTITRDDLSLAYAAGVDRKLPVLLYSPGKIAKPAKNYLETISGVVKFKQLVG